MGKNNLEKEPNYLEQHLNICDERIGTIECNTETVLQLIENTLSNSGISLSNLNILEIPIEIDGILYNTSDIDLLNITPETQVTYSTDKNVTNELDIQETNGNCYTTEVSTSLDDLWLKHMPWPTTAEMINPNKKKE